MAVLWVIRATKLRTEKTADEADSHVTDTQDSACILLVPFVAVVLLLAGNGCSKVSRLVMAEHSVN